MRILTTILCLSSLAHAQYTTISTATDHAFTFPLRKTDTVIQSGTDARNRFVMHRVKRVVGFSKGAILLLPSLLSSFSEYTIDGSGDVMQSLAATLALAGYDVWGYSPRTSTIPTHGCSSGAVDCSILATWGITAYLGDIEYVRSQIGQKPAVGGLSMGGMLGMATVNAHPHEYAGLLMWESMLYSANPTITSLNQTNCAGDEAQLATGVYYDESIQDAALFLLSLGEAASVSLFGNPLPLFGTPTFTVDVPTADHSAFLYADFSRFSAMILADHSVESWRLIADMNCSQAGDRTFTGNLGAFVKPVLAIGGGQAYGAYMGDNLAILGSASKTFAFTPEFGHADAYLSASHDSYVEDTILGWLDCTVFSRR